MSFCQRLGGGPFSDPRKPLGFKRDLDIRRTSRKSPRSRENRGFANIERNAVQHRETPAKPGFYAALDGVGNYAAWAAACCRMTSRKISPYCLSFSSPTPCTAALSAMVGGFRRALAIRVLSANT